MNNLLIDTCFWFALFNATDSDHKNAIKLMDYLEIGNILIPYPTLYETVNTKFCENKNWVNEFEKTLENRNINLIDDVEYKENALSITFDSAIKKNRPLSLVDTIIRLMLEDINLKVDYLISFNIADFSDICKKRNIEILFN